MLRLLKVAILQQSLKIVYSASAEIFNRYKCTLLLLPSAFNLKF